ncbi:MAG: hypothetical protein ACI863_000631, partial [Flavobacteriales bacterium]
MNKMKHIFTTFTLLLAFAFSYSQEIAILKYDGGGDWYANPTALPNLIAYCNQNIHTKIESKPK